MISKEELKKYLLENCVDKNGNINLSGLDFSDFDGDVNISEINVKGDLFQNRQNVQGELFQNRQNVQGELFQSEQTVQGDLLQGYQTVQGSFITQTLAEDEEYEIKGSNTYIVKKRKKLTKEEIEELLGYKIEIVKEN